MLRRYRTPTDDPAQPYYIEWNPKNWDRFDDHGVPFASFYNPVTVAQYALQLYPQARAGDECARGRFLAQADYLIRSQRSDGAYPYQFALPRYGAAPGWISAMAQGAAASVLFRAYALTGCGDYRDVALQTLAPLQTDISDGGASLIRGDLVFFEEVSAQPCHILNGHLFAAFAVWEACQFAHVSPKLRHLHERAVETLLGWLPLYDAQGWSYYQLAARDNDERHYAPILYHQAHIAQLYVYTAMTQREAFRSMADRWRSGLNRTDVRVRVWKDGTKWLARSVRRRLRAKRQSHWQSTLIVTDACGTADVPRREPQLNAHAIETIGRKV